MFRSPDQTEVIDWRALAGYLAAQGLRADLSRAPRQFAGGLGNWNFLIEIDGRPFVLRRPPSGPLPAGANDMAREYRILSRLHPHFPVAPCSPLFCADPGVIGAPFLLIEYREGVVVRAEVPAELASRLDPQAFTSRAVDVLARLHALDPAAVGLQDLGRPEGMVARQARNWTLRAQGAFDDRVPRALLDVAQWLAGPAPQAQRVSILHSDFKFDNLIVSPDSADIVALIDWDMGTLGDPLLDLAILLSYWAEPDDPPAMRALRQMPTAARGFPRRADVLAMYASRSGIDVDTFKYYRVLALFKLCVVFQQIYQRHLRGLTQDERVASFGALTAGLIEFTANALADDKL